MKIITIWQPWATLIALGIKKFETRSWSTEYTGPLAIHAAKRKVNRNELAKISYDSVGHIDFSYLDNIDYPYGQIVAVSNLKACRWMVDEDRLREVYRRIKGKQEADSYTRDYLIQQSEKDEAIWIWLPGVNQLEKSVGDWQLGRHAWQLESIRKIQPINYKGTQGLRTLDSETSEFLESITGELNVRI